MVKFFWFGFSKQSLPRHYGFPSSVLSLSRQPFISYLNFFPRLGVFAPWFLCELSCLWTYYSFNVKVIFSLMVFLNVCFHLCNLAVSRVNVCSLLCPLVNILPRVVCLQNVWCDCVYKYKFILFTAAFNRRSRVCRLFRYAFIKRALQWNYYH